MSGERFNPVTEVLNIGKNLLKREAAPTVVPSEKAEKKQQAQMRADLQRQLRRLSAQFTPKELQAIINSIDIRDETPKVSIPNIPGTPSEVREMTDLIRKIASLEEAAKQAST